MVELVMLGVTFHDAEHGEVVLAVEAPWRGWLCREAEGAWVGLRRATAEDVAVVKSLILPALHELVVLLSAGETS